MVAWHPGIIAVLDLAEAAFGDLLGEGRQKALFRFGRQELAYVSGTLIALREGPSVRADYDGGLVRIAAGKRVSDVFFVYRTVDSNGAWSNKTDMRRPSGAFTHPETKAARFSIFSTSLTASRQEYTRRA